MRRQIYKNDHPYEIYHEMFIKVYFNIAKRLLFFINRSRSAKYAQTGID